MPSPAGWSSPLLSPLPNITLFDFLPLNALKTRNKTTSLMSTSSSFFHLFLHLFHLPLPPFLPLLPPPFLCLFFFLPSSFPLPLHPPHQPSRLSLLLPPPLSHSTFKIAAIFKWQFTFHCPTVFNACPLLRSVSLSPIRQDYETSGGLTNEVLAAIYLCTQFNGDLMSKMPRQSASTKQVSCR